MTRMCVCDPKYEVNLVPQKKVVNLCNAHFRELCLCLPVHICPHLCVPIGYHVHVYARNPQLQTLACTEKTLRTQKHVNH